MEGQGLRSSRGFYQLIVVVALVTCLVAGSGAQAAPLPTLYRVNAPYFGNDVRFAESGVFWFGRVTPSENYADVRVGYTDSSLWIHVNIIDRRLWYNDNPSASTLTNWDSVTLYLDKRGNTGGTPSADSYRFDAQLSWWEPRTNYQATYRGNGSSWISQSLPLLTYNNWYGDVPNTNVDDHGWYMAYYIPFSSFGLSGPPAPGTIWGLGLAVHDRDTETGEMNPDKVWPLSLSTTQPSSWGQLRFGLPGHSLPAPAIQQGTTVVRQDLNGPVPDAVVGGNTLCGGSPNDDWNKWGNLNYAHQTVFNVQNVEQVSEWPCFSKAFITFPLNSLPADKQIISATLTLYHRGNPGPAPDPSYIQVLTVDQDWDENTITWNNAPLARENLGGTWIPSLPDTPPYPGIPYRWDISRAVAEAYAAGEPLQLAVYSADGPFHSGRYFYSSDVEDLNAQGRPTLTVAWGTSVSALQANVTPSRADFGETVTYTLGLLSSGSAMTLTDSLPALVSAPKSLQATSGTVVYTAGQHRVEWYGKITAGTAVTITFPVDILATGPQAVANTVQLVDGVIGSTSSTAQFIANGYGIYLPTVLR
jgi:hypothetical protein